MRSVVKRGLVDEQGTVEKIKELEKKMERQYGHVVQQLQKETEELAKESCPWFLSLFSTALVFR